MEKTTLKDFLMLCYGVYLKEKYGRPPDKSSDNRKSDSGGKDA